MATRVRTSTRVGAADFDRRMKMFGARVVERSNQGVIDLANIVVESLIANTPKKTGQAAANWQVSIGTPILEFKQGFVDYNQALSQAKAVIATRQAGQTIHVVNNAPYIMTLNAGSSTQAPAGFIEKTLVAANNKLRRIKLLT